MTPWPRCRLTRRMRTPSSCSSRCARSRLMGDLYYVLLAIVLVLVVAQVAVPFTFVSGTTIDPDQVNTNFAALGNSSLNRAGGAMSGTLGVTAGTPSAPGLYGTAQPTTGVRLNLNELGLSVAAVEELLLTPGFVNLLNGSLIAGAAGVSFYGNGLVNNAGKIPDLSSSYFAAISASNFTTGTVPAARLGSNPPTAYTFLRGDNVWAYSNFQTVVKTSAYTAAINEFVLANGTFTVSLPTAVGIINTVINVKNMGTGVITVDPAGAETIDGQPTYVIAVQYQSLTLVSDGANWVIQ